jgi:hypothetical protein
MLSRIAALLPLCSHVRVLVSAARPKESSFLQRRTKFSERRSERPDVTEASSSRPPALRTGGKGVWSHTTDSSYAFRFKDFTFNAQNVFTGWVIIAGETTVDETGNANAGPATVEVYNPNGVLVATLCADAVGTRFEL